MTTIKFWHPISNPFYPAKPCGDFWTALWWQWAPPDARKVFIDRKWGGESKLRSQKLFYGTCGAFVCMYSQKAATCSSNDTYARVGIYTATTYSTCICCWCCDVVHHAAWMTMSGQLANGSSKGTFWGLGNFGRDGPVQYLQGKFAICVALRCVLVSTAQWQSRNIKRTWKLKKHT